MTCRDGSQTCLYRDTLQYIMLSIKSLPRDLKTSLAQFFKRGKSSEAVVHLISPILFTLIVLFMLIIGGVSLQNALGVIGRPFAGFLFYDYRVVGSFGDYEWPGLQAGIRHRDVLLEVNGRRISSGRDVQNIVNQTPVGQKLSDLLDRKGEKIRLEIPISLFTLADFLKIFALPFLGGLIFWAIGIIAYFLKRDTSATWAFLLFCLFLGLYLVTGFAIQSITYLPWSNFINIGLGMSFFPAAGLHLSLVFPEKTAWVQKRPRLQALPYVISLLLMLSLMSDIAALTDERLDTGEIILTAAHMLRTVQCARFYALLAAISIVASCVYVYWHSSSAIAKQRARVVLLGSGVAFIPAAAAMSLVSLGKLVIPLNFFSLPVIVFPATIGYAIARHDLFDVDVYIKRAVGYVMMTTIVATAYLAMQTLTRTFLLNPLFGESAEQVYPLLFAVLVVFLFDPVNRKVQENVEKIFFRKKFDYKETISSVSSALASVLNLDQVVKQVVYTIRKEMFVDAVGVIVLEPQKQRCQTFFVGDGLNSGKDQVTDVGIASDDPLLALVSREKKLITKYDIEEDTRYRGVKEACEQSLAEMAASIAVPLIYQDKVTGILALGHKKSGHFYTREDIDLLYTLADQTAVAIENAKLFQEYVEKTRLDEELKIAHDIQVSMLPEKAPELEGIQIAARSIPARQVGGDFYDFIEVPGEEARNGATKRLGIVIADVSGKAVSAALLMAASRSIFRVLTESHSSVEEVMSRGNQRLNKDIKKGTFVALLYAVVDPQHKTLTLSNAGQTQPIICPGDQSAPAYITTDGDKFPLGIVKNCQYQETRLALQPGDAIVFYTDGIVEAMNEKKEMYGFERLMAAVENGKRSSATILLEGLIDGVSSFVGNAEQHDDLTLVVLKVE